MKFSLSCHDTVPMICLGLGTNTTWLGLGKHDDLACFGWLYNRCLTAGFDVS